MPIHPSSAHQLPIMMATAMYDKPANGESSADEPAPVAVPEGPERKHAQARGAEGVSWLTDRSRGSLTNEQWQRGWRGWRGWLDSERLEGLQ